MKNLLGRKVKLNGDNEHEYNGYGKIVGYDVTGVIIEIPNKEGWNIMEDKETYITDYKIPEGHSLMFACEYEYELIDKPTFNSLEIGDHFWAKISNKIAVFIYHGEDDIQVCGGWEGDFKSSKLEFISKVEMPNGYTKEDLYY